MATIRFRPPEGLTGYGILGGIAGFSGSIAPDLIVGVLFAIILAWLFKACRWLYQRNAAMRQDTQALRVGKLPSELANWKNRLVEGRKDLDRQSKIIWFSCLISVMLLFGLMPPRKSGELFALTFLAAIGLIVALFVVCCFSRYEFAQAVHEQSKPKD